jgi:hypothetical protein
MPATCKLQTTIQVATGNVLYVAIDPTRANGTSATLSPIHYRVIAHGGDATVAITNHVNWPVQPYATVVADGNLDGLQYAFQTVGCSWSAWASCSDATKRPPNIRICSSLAVGHTGFEHGEAVYLDKDTQADNILGDINKSTKYAWAPNLGATTAGNAFDKISYRRAWHAHGICPLILDKGGVMAYHPGQTGDPIIADFYGRGMPMLEIYNDTGVTWEYCFAVLCNYVIPITAAFALAYPGAVHHECRERIDVNVIPASSVGGLGSTAKEAIGDVLQAVQRLGQLDPNIGYAMAKALVDKGNRTGATPITAHPSTVPVSIQHETTSREPKAPVL